MSDTIKAAVILASAVIVAAVLNGGIYQIDSGYRLNRFTGDVQYMFGGRARASVPTIAELAKRPAAVATESRPFAGQELNPETLKPIAPGWVSLGAGWWCQSQTDYRQQPHCLRALRPEEVEPKANPMATP